MIEVYTCLNNNYNSYTISNISELNKTTFFDSWVVNINGIVGLSITDDLIIIIREIISSTFGCTKIIDVYDYTGKLLWCINDLFKEIIPIYGGIIVNKSRLSHYIKDVHFEENHNYYSCFRGGQNIVIDLSNKKIVAVLPNK